MTFNSPLPPAQRRMLIVLTLMLGLQTICLGVVGLVNPPSANLEADTLAAWSALLFDAAALLALNLPADPPSNLWFSLARLSALGFASVAVLTVLLSVSRVFAAWAGRIRIGWWSFLRPDRAHAVIFGLDANALQLVRDIRAAERRDVIVVQPHPDPALAEKARQFGALVLTGDPMQADVRHHARIHLARELFVAFCDAARNVALVSEVIDDLRGGRLVRPARCDRLQCFLKIEDPGFGEMLRSHFLIDIEDAAIDVSFYDVRRHATRRLLVDEKEGIASLYGPGPDEVAHVVILGFGQMGQMTALELGHLAHFENLRRLRMTLVDEYGSDDESLRGRRRFVHRYPAFCPDPDSFDLTGRVPDRWTDRSARPGDERLHVEPPGVEYAVNAEFLDRSADDPELLEELLVRVQRYGVRPVLIVCFDDDRRNLATAFRMIDRLAAMNPERLPAQWPVYVYLPKLQRLADLARAAVPDPRFPLHPFGETNRDAGYRAIARPMLRTLAEGFQSAYDPSKPYHRLSPRFKASVDEAAAHALVKLRAENVRVRALRHGEQPLAVGARLGAPSGAGSGRNLGAASGAGSDAALADPERLAMMEHNRWMAERLITGWRYEALPDGFEDLGEEERRQIHDEMAGRKRRSSLVPWESLSERERDKDRDQVGILLRALKAARQTVEKIPTSPRA